MSRYALLAVAISVGLLVALGCDNGEEVDDPDDGPPEEVEVLDQQDEEDETDEDQDDEEATLELPNMHEPGDQIIASAQPDDGDLEAMAERGVELIVNLREDDEEGFVDASERARELGIEYVHIPVHPQEGLTDENVDKLDEALAGVDGESVVHCGTAERAGGLLALRAHWKLDKESDAALEYGESAGLDELGDDVAAAME